MSAKELFKLWVEEAQLKRLKALAAREKVSVAWLIRRSIDEFLAKQGKKRS